MLVNVSSRSPLGYSHFRVFHSVIFPSEMLGVGTFDESLVSLPLPLLGWTCYYIGICFGGGLHLDTGHSYLSLASRYFTRSISRELSFSTFWRYSFSCLFIYFYKCPIIHTWLLMFQLCECTLFFDSQTS